MKNRTCRICNRQYGNNDPQDVMNEHQDGLGFIPYSDEEWNPQDGRCWECYLDFLCDIFGGWLEPCITINGEEWMASGKVPDGPNLTTESGDIPF